MKIPCELAANQSVSGRTVGDDIGSSVFSEGSS
eukprot:COSAG04_NODE_22518_length_353_cov_1.220472_1_plen_32_part_10